MMVFKVLRLFRLARTVRLIAQFKVLWMLVRGLLYSLNTIFFTFVIIFLIIYIYACLALELITKSSFRDDDVFNTMVELYFPDMPYTMMTLTQFVTCDSAASIYGAFIPYNPLLYSIYFFGFLLVVSVALMNLVTAVIVEGSLDQASNDKDAARAYEQAELKKIIPKIRDMFEALDADGSGTLELDEVKNAPESVKRELAICMQTDELVDLFELLDLDDSGEIRVDEFIDGLSKIAISKEPLDSVRQKKQVEKLCIEVSKILELTKAMFSGVDHLKATSKEKATRDKFTDNGADLERSEPRDLSPRRPAIYVDPTVVSSDGRAEISQMHQAILSMTELQTQQMKLLQSVLGRTTELERKMGLETIAFLPEGDPREETTVDTTRFCNVRPCNSP
jgi:hypothetical protein